MDANDDPAAYYFFAGYVVMIITLDGVVRLKQEF